VSAAVVLGARNLGAAITRDLLARGTHVAAIARTQADLDALALAGAVPVQADATNSGELAAALERAAAAVGPPDLLVNAVSASRPPGDGSGFGGGALADATVDGFDGWAVAVAQQAFVFLRAAVQALAGRGGTVVQITGGPARRANPERGPAAAGMAAVRALAHASAQEQREGGTHVALLIVDGIIESPKTARMAAGMAADALVSQADVVAAVNFLASQSSRGLTHELVITPCGGRWLP
jgi:NAD(P)-dependent dehydrogenase (short-subunit alcohol dehydrogenase family)